MSIVVALPIAAAIALFFNKRIEETVAPAIFSVITLLYFSGIITTFTPGIILSLVFAVACAVYTVITCVKSRERIKENLFTPGLIVFLALSVYFLFVAYGRIFNQGTDEGHHWAIVIKYFYMLNDYSNVPMTTDMAPYHCPAVSLWDYFSTKLWLSCSTGIMMWGQQIMAVSLLLPLFAHITSFKEKNKILITTLFITVLPYCLRDVNYKFVGYTTFQPDYIQYLLMAVALIYFRQYYLKKDGFYLGSSLFSVFILVLSKRTGIIDAIVYLIIIYAVMLLHKEFDLKKTWTVIGANLAAIGAAYLTWELYLTFTGTVTGGLSGTVAKMAGKLFAAGPVVVIGAIVVAIVVCIVLWKLQTKKPIAVIAALMGAYTLVCIYLIKAKDVEESFKNEAFAYVARTFLGHDLTGYDGLIKIDVPQIGHGIPISMGAFLLLCIILWRVAILKKEEMSDKNKFDDYMVIFLVVGYVLMQIFRLMGAIAFMAYKNQPTLAASDNYLGPYLLAMLVVLGELWLDHDRTRGDLGVNKTLVMLFAIMLFFNCGSIVLNLVEKPTEHYFYALEGQSFNYGDKIYLMDTNIENENLNPDFYFQVAPASSSAGSWYIDGYMSDRLTPEEVSDKLINGKFNYVYIENLGPDYKGYYDELFANPGDMDNNHLYSVNVVDGMVSLVLVN